MEIVDKELRLLRKEQKKRGDAFAKASLEEGLEMRAKKFANTSDENVVDKLGRAFREVLGPILSEEKGKYLCESSCDVSKGELKYLLKLELPEDKNRAGKFARNFLSIVFNETGVKKSFRHAHSSYKVDQKDGKSVVTMNMSREMAEKILDIIEPEKVKPVHAEEFKSGRNLLAYITEAYGAITRKEI